MKKQSRRDSKINFITNLVIILVFVALAFNASYDEFAKGLEIFFWILALFFLLILFIGNKNNS